MSHRAVLVVAVIAVAMAMGCVAVAPEVAARDAALKASPQPAADKAALYVFRSGFVGHTMKKKVYVDGVLLGEMANETYCYRELAPGPHELATESEFGRNKITFQAAGGTSHFAEQYMKVGVFETGANVRMVSAEDGMKGVRGCQLVQ